MSINKKANSYFPNKLFADLTKAELAKLPRPATCHVDDLCIVGAKVETGHANDTALTAYTGPEGWTVPTQYDDRNLEPLDTVLMNSIVRIGWMPSSIMSVCWAAHPVTGLPIVVIDEGGHRCKAARAALKVKDGKFDGFARVVWSDLQNESDIERLTRTYASNASHANSTTTCIRTAVQYLALGCTKKQAAALMGVKMAPFAQWISIAEALDKFPALREAMTLVTSDGAPVTFKYKLTDPETGDITEIEREYDPEEKVQGTIGPLSASAIRNAGLQKKGTTDAQVFEFLKTRWRTPMISGMRRLDTLRRFGKAPPKELSYPPRNAVSLGKRAMTTFWEAVRGDASFDPLLKAGDKHEKSEELIALRKLVRDSFGSQLTLALCEFFQALGQAEAAVVACAFPGQDTDGNYQHVPPTTADSSAVLAYKEIAEQGRTALARIYRIALDA